MKGRQLKNDVGLTLQHMTLESISAWVLNGMVIGNDSTIGKWEFVGI